MRCGAYIPGQHGASVVDERALIAWDGSREDILMSLRVTGSSDTAAWVMPVPSAAQISLGEAEAFTELGRLTAPRIEYRDTWWPTFSWLTAGGVSEGAMAGAPPGAGVNVLGRQRIGPFDVIRVAAQDPTSIPVAGNTPNLEFAGRIERADVSPALADFVGDGAFLTQWNNFIAEPASIDGDYIFEQATADATYQQVIYRDRNRGDLTGLTLLVFVGLGGVMIVIALTRRRGPAEHRLS